MNLTIEQKLITQLLCEIHQKLEIEDGLNSKLISQAILTGNEWAIEWDIEGQSISTTTRTKEEVSLVCDILDMWDFIELSYDDYSEEDKERIEREANPFGHDVAFKGFDGNSESDYISIANFLINEMGRFQRFEGRGLNSHIPSIDSARRMLDVYKQIQGNLGFDNALSPDNVIEILNARRA